MSVPARKLFDIEFFFDFVAREEGKWELYDGQAVAMAPERARHAL